MSKIVILNSALAAPHIASDALARLAVANPAMAKWAEKFDTLPLIKEAAMKATENLKSQGVTIDSAVADYQGMRISNVGGEQFLTVLKTDFLPRGLAIILTKDGTIKFAADDYCVGRQISRLQNMFQNAFLQECLKMFLDIMGYKFTTVLSQVKDPETGELSQCALIQAEK